MNALGVEREAHSDNLGVQKPNEVDFTSFAVLYNDSYVFVKEVKKSWSDNGVCEIH